MNKKQQHTILLTLITLFKTPSFIKRRLRSVPFPKLREREVRGVFFTLFFFIGLLSQAQTYPVQVIPQITPPPAVYLSDYANTSNTTDRIKAQLLLTDLTVMNRQVRLKLYIEGSGFNTQSNDFIIGAQPLFLDGGIPLQLGSIDLAPYFELQNLNGISAGAYANTMPEGLYQFCFEVYDVLSGNKISSKSCTNVLVFLNDPPFLNLPTNNINLEAYNPQNILFQWTPRHINVSNVEYEFSLVEIWDYSMDPQAVFVSSPPLYQITTSATTLLYGISEPQLIEGKRYAWRVQAKAKSGVDEIGLFKNKGFSEIFSFTYQGECAEPSFLKVADVTPKTATFSWQGNLEHTKYKIDYRKAIDEDGNTGNQNSYKWFESQSNREEFIVIDLEPNTLYEWRVGGYCADGTLTYAASETFTTMEKEAEAYYNCGIEPTIDIANQILLDDLQKGDVIKAGDFNVKITEVSGNGSFNGKGYTTVGFLKNLKIALEFSNIQVNTAYQFVNGEIKTVYDPSWSNILDIDEVIDEVEDIVDVFTGDDNDIITLDYDTTESDIKIDKDKGKIIITDSNGDEHTYDYDEGDEYTITDKSGDQFFIDTNGDVTQTGTGAEGGAATASNTSGITNGHNSTTGDASVRSIENNGVRILYSKGSTTIYELDQANNTYEKSKYPKVAIEGTKDFYYPVHKAVADGTSDVFYATIINNNTAKINIDSLIFKTVSGTAIEAVKSGADKYKITVNGHGFYKNEEAIISYKDKDGKQHVLSSFFIHHIKKHPNINVQVVLVHGDNSNEQAQDIPGLEKKLQSIYAPAGAPIVVGNTQTVNIPQSEWDTEISNGKIDYNGSGLDSDYPQELNAIRRYYKSQNPNYDPKAYYIFVLNPSIKATKALSGFMPKTRQWGFIFQAHTTGLENKPDEATTVAHELGHGVFALGHPFGKNPENAPVADTWLMDYAHGTELAYPNWAAMSDKSLKLYLFQDDGGSEIAGKTWFTPKWKSFKIKNTSTFNVSNVSSNHVQGTVPGFNLRDTLDTTKVYTYKAIYDTNGTFKHYKSNSAGVFKIDDHYVILTNPEDKVYLFEYNGGCNKDKYYKSDWEYVENHKNAIDFKNKKVNDLGIIQCPINLDDLCDTGKKYFNSYKKIVTNEGEKQYLLKVSKMICDKGTKELIEAQKVQYEKWKASLKTIPQLLSQKPFSFEAYYNALNNLKKWVESDTDTIITAKNRTLLFKTAYALDVKVLSLISIEKKLEILQILLSDKLYNLFTYNQDKLVVKIVEAVKDEEATDFISGLTSDKYNDKKKNPLIYNLKERLSDYFNADKSYSGFFTELKRISDTKNRLNNQNLDIPSINWDVKQKDYVLLSYVKVNNDFEYSYDKSNHTNSIRTCIEYEYRPDPSNPYSSVTKFCKEDKYNYLLEKNSSPFDLVAITFINDVSPFGSKYISDTKREIEGEILILPAIFLDYLTSKLIAQQIENLAWNTFNIVLTVSTLGEGGAVIIAIRNAKTGTRLAIAAKNAWVLADFAYTVTDLGLKAGGVERPEIWKDIGYVFAVKGAYDLAKGVAGLKNASKKTRRKIVDELGVKKQGKSLTDTEIDEFLVKAETKLKDKPEYKTATKNIITKNKFTNSKFEKLEAVKPQKTKQTNLGKKLFDSDAALKLTPTNKVLQSKVDDILENGDKGGNITEEISDILYQTDGFVKKEVKLGSNQGIDGLYVKGSIENPTAIRIDEAKYSKNFDKKGIQLNKAKESTELPPQMSDDWIENVADRMIKKGIKNGDEDLVKLGNMLKNNSDKIQKSVTTVNPKTGEINILKLDNYKWIE